MASNSVLQDTENFLEARRQAYVAVFDNPMGQQVLADLAVFCRANASTFDPDPRLSAMLDGRREVFLRICENLQLTQDELFNLKMNGTKK